MFGDIAQFPGTERTPRVLEPGDILAGQRGAHGNHVYARCPQGHLMRLGRPWAVGQSLDDVPDRPCPLCAEVRQPLRG